jgi:hypothetical protein
MSEYDSTAETLRHSLRVGELMGQVIRELVERSVRHDISKTQDPELAVFNEFTPKLKTSTYGSEEYKGFLEAMGDGLAHHYASNRHHPEHFPHGVNDMTLADLIEMLADWKAAGERHADGSLGRSLQIQRERFGLSDQLFRILWNTGEANGWLPVCGATHIWGMEHWTCNVPLDADGRHDGPHADGNYTPGAEWPTEWAEATS